MSEIHCTERGVVFKSLDFLGYPKYRVGDDGSVWSRCNNRWGIGTWKKRTLEIRPDGRLCTDLWNAGIHQKFLVHRLVLLAFVGPCPDGMEACHFPDRDPANCNVGNLIWGTHTENQHHRKIHGTDNQGSKHGMSKLTEEVALEIRKRAVKGLNQWNRGNFDVLAKEFGVSARTIARIACNAGWKHLKKRG